MKSALNGEAEVAARVRRELQALQRSRARLSITLINPTNNSDEALASVVEQVRDNDIVISQPSSGALTRPLAAGERVRIGFALTRGFATAEAKVLGRIKLQSGGQRMFFGYRLTLPTSLHTEERRQHPRVPFEYGSEPVVHLTPVDQNDGASISGFVQDISIGGAQIRVDGAATSIKVGARLLLVADFPPPVGAISHPCTVMRITRDPNTEVTRLGLLFVGSIPNLNVLIDTLRAKNLRRG